MRLLADSNIARVTASRLRSLGHDVVWVGERDDDPGDKALLAEAHREGRIFLTKDRDLGTLVFRDREDHAGILLLDELHEPHREAEFVAAVLQSHAAVLAAGGFVRAALGNIRTDVGSAGE